jgi:hypothetical protein
MSIPLIAKVVHEKTDRTGTFLSTCSDCNNIFAEYDHVDYCFNNYLSNGTRNLGFDWAIKLGRI